MAKQGTKQLIFCTILLCCSGMKSPRKLPLLPGGRLNMGAATLHAPGHVTDWALERHYVVMLFHTEFEAETSEGRTRGQAGQMLINPPGTRHWHRGVGDAPFCNDWIQLEEGKTRDSLAALDLPIHQIFSVSRSDFFQRLIREMEQELVENAPHKEALIDSKIQELLLLTDRYCQLARRKARSPVEHSHYETLCIIRREMQERCTEPWTVAAMARQAHLSANRFAVLYKKFFHVSPVEDLIDTRIARARLLLAGGRCTVAEVADQCGFSNPNYFSRLFRKRTGHPPTALF